MPPGRYCKSSWLDEFQESKKYIGSFTITVLINGKLLEADVRQSEDQTYYSVILNRTFFGHLIKDAGSWRDITGVKTETISEIGKLIEEHLK